MIRLIKRFVIFLNLLLLSLFSFYFIGNYQNFLDSTLRMILSIQKILSIATIIFSVFGIISVIWGSIKFKKPSYLFLLIFYLFSIIFASILIVFSFTITVEF